ncbi:MAG: sodium:proton antiporter [Gammaproteobacteria bacterium]|jgi:CPA1 family monovalent cation:H+ antiporter
MSVAGIIFTFTAMLIAALAVEPLARRLNLPFSAMLVAAGFTGSELLTRNHFDLGLRWYHFHDLVLFVLLPVLIFESAFNMRLRVLLANLVAVLILAIPLMLLSAAVSAVAIYYGINHPTGFPWIAALLAGALLAATDPVAVIDLGRRFGLPERLVILIEGESLFNDATAIVLFGVLLAIATMEGPAPEPVAALADFTSVFLGGLLVGIAVGVLAWLVFRLTRDEIARGVTSLVAAYSSVLMAEVYLHVSSVMAVLATGLLLGATSRRGGENGQFLGMLWRLNAWIANAAIFLLAGITITTDMFTSQWLAIGIGIVAVLMARAVGIFGVLPLLRWLPGVQPVEPAWQRVMFWGGLRGAVVLALALSLPTELPYWYTIQAIAYGVVVFTLFVQAPTMPLLLRRIGVPGNDR